MTEQIEMFWREGVSIPGDHSKGCETVACCVFLDSMEKEFSFAESLTALRKERGYTIPEIAEKTRKAQRTVDYWLAGQSTPSRGECVEILKILTDSSDPSRRKRQEMRRLHNLTWDKAKRRWKLRLTVPNPRRPKEVGIRLNLNLRTDDEAVAINTRDVLMDALRQLKTPATVRKQKRSS